MHLLILNNVFFHYEDVQQVLLILILKKVESLNINPMTPNYSYINTFNTQNRIKIIKQSLSLMIIVAKYLRVSILR